MSSATTEATAAASPYPHTHGPRLVAKSRIQGTRIHAFNQLWQHRWRWVSLVHDLRSVCFAVHYVARPDFSALKLGYLGLQSRKESTICKPLNPMGDLRWSLYVPLSLVSWIVVNVFQVVILLYESLLIFVVAISANFSDIVQVLRTFSIQSWPLKQHSCTLPFLPVYSGWRLDLLLAGISLRVWKIYVNWKVFRGKDSLIVKCILCWTFRKGLWRLVIVIHSSALVERVTFCRRRQH